MKSVYFKGLKKAVIVDDKLGDSLAEQKAKGVNSFVRLDGYSGEISDIKHIVDGIDEESRENYKQQNRDEKAKSNDEDMEKANKEYRLYVKRYVDGDMTYKMWENIRYAGFVCFAMTGIKLEEWRAKNPDDFEKLKEIIKADIPKYEIAKPTSYKKLFEMVDDNKNSVAIARHASLRFVERQLSEMLHTIRDIKR